MGDTSNELAMNQIMESLRITAMTAQQHSEQMGLILANQRQMTARIDSIESTIVQNTQTINDRMQNYEDRLRVTRTQAQSLRGAIHDRVNKVLGITYEDDVIKSRAEVHDDVFYKKRFIQKLYTDARKYSRLGTPYYETLARDYEEVIDYISKWIPMVGIDGLKNYFDTRQEMRSR